MRHNAHNLVTFNEGTIPQVEEILRRYPRSPTVRCPTEEMPADEEEGRAWLLTMHGYEHAVRYGYDSRIEEPYQTILVGPSDERGVFDRWFEGMPAGYRLMFHRSAATAPQSSPSSSAAHCWERVYRRLGLKHRRTPDALMTGPVIGTLERLLDSYSGGTEGIDTIIEQTGHPYAQSVGGFAFLKSRLSS